MRRAAAGLLLLAAGCRALDPTAATRDAARRLSFSLDRVEPRLELAFPLERSRLRLRLRLGVENPSDVRLAALALAGRLSLDVRGVRHELGEVRLPAGMDLAPRSRSEVPADLVFEYGTLKRAWEAMRAAVEGREPAAWRLEGEARIGVAGISVIVPIRATERSGAGRPGGNP